MLLTAVALLALYGRLAYLFEPFGGDGAIFVYMGKVVAHGGAVGREIVDNKFPTVGLMISGAWRFCAANWAGYVLLQAAVVLLGCLMLARAVGKWIAAPAGVATLIAGLVLMNLSPALGGGFQLESFQAALAMIAAAAALPALVEDDLRDSVLVGLATGTAMLFKPSGVAILAGFALAAGWRWWRRPGRLALHGVASLLGMAVPLAVAVCYLRTAGLLPLMPEIWRQISLYASQSRLLWWDLGKWIAVLAIGGTPLLIRGVVLRRQREAWPVDASIVAFAIAWWAIEATGVLAQRRMYPYHFLVLAPPTVLIFSLIPRRQSALSLAATLLLPLLLSQYGAWCWWDHYQRPNQRLALSDYLAAHAGPTDAVWKENLMRLLVETDLEPGARYPVTFIWANDANAADRYSLGLLADLRERHPRYVVLPTDMPGYLHKMTTQLRELELDPDRQAAYRRGWQRILNHIDDQYTPLATVGRETVYERRPDAERGQALATVDSSPVLPR